MSLWKSKAQPILCHILCKTLIVETVAPKCRLLLKVKIHCLKKTITHWAKIRPIWSPCPTRFLTLIEACHLLCLCLFLTSDETWEYKVSVRMWWRWHFLLFAKSTPRGTWRGRCTIEKICKNIRVWGVDIFLLRWERNCSEASFLNCSSHLQWRAHLSWRLGRLRVPKRELAPSLFLKKNYPQLLSSKVKTFCETLPK
jgi:hypothetical protein